MSVTNVPSAAELAELCGAAGLHRPINACDLFRAMCIAFAMGETRMAERLQLELMSATAAAGAITRARSAPNGSEPKAIHVQDR